MHSPQNWHMFVNNSPRCLIVYVVSSRHIFVLNWYLKNYIFSRLSVHFIADNNGLISFPFRMNGAPSARHAY